MQDDLGVYDLLHACDREEPDAARIWTTKLPGKVKFFSRLLHHGRLTPGRISSTKTFGGREESNCEFCHDVLETDEHIFTICSRARAVWSRLGIGITPG